MKRSLLLIALLSIFTAPAPAAEWKAQFITLEHTQSRPATWGIWRKQANLTSVPSSVTARIATDTKYWLWINDRMVVFEGGLKRGPKPNATYYDEIEIAPYLCEGENTIALLTWHFGLNGFSHVNSGSMGLVFQAEGDGVLICSDASWRGDVYEAYSETGLPRPNYRISESNIRFDGRMAMEGWYLRDSGEELSEVLPVDLPNCPLGELLPRPIPQWKDCGFREYVRTEMKGDTLVCHLPYNCQFTPYVKLRSDRPGQVLDIRTDVHMIGDSYTVRCEYVTREGVQEYENYGWMNGHQVWYIIPEGVELLDVKYRETGYGADFTEPFHCDDPFFDELWKRAQRTLYITMRDNYMDCPDRERGQWWGDAVNELGETFYSLTPPAQKLAEKGLDEVFNWQRADGVLFSPCPAGNWNKELPSQILAAAGYYGLYTQCFYSGDFSVADRHFDRLHRYLHEVWQRDPDGLVYLRHGDWFWGDWGDDKDQLLLQNIWYYLALKGERLIALETGRTQAAEEDAAMMEQFEKAFERRFWTGTCYRSPDYEDETDDRGNALAVVSSLAPKDKYPLLTKLLTKEYHASPYMEKYVLEALFEMNAASEGLDRIKNRYRPLIEIEGLTTLPENWRDATPIDPGVPLVDNFFGTYNHGWTGGPLTILSQKVCGVEPTSPGFRTFRIRPQLGYLKEASCTVESTSGTIRVSVHKTKKGLRITAEVPEGTTAEIVFPSGQSRTLGTGSHTIEGR